MVFGVLRTVLGRKRYAFMATIVAGVILTFAAFSANLSLWFQILSSNTFTLTQKLSFSFSLYGSLFSNFTLLSAVSTIAISVLFGMNIALLVFYIRRRKQLSPKITTNAAGFAGLVSGFFGIGCAACGSVIISALLGSAVGGALLLALPLHGAEFGLLGVALLGYSVIQLCKRIADPAVCTI